jgi:hypothetical protein
MHPNFINPRPRAFVNRRAAIDAEQISKLGARNSWVSVYDGQRCVGHIICRGRDGFEAFDLDDKSAGMFATQAAAAAALVRP